MRRDRRALPEVIRHVESEVRHGLQGMASFETPKKIALLEEEFTIRNGALTPTLKVKRRVVQDRCKDLIDRLYSETGPGLQDR